MCNAERVARHAIRNAMTATSDLTGLRAGPGVGMLFPPQRCPEPRQDAPVDAVSCELVSCFPVFQGKSRELCWPNLAGSRRRPPKCEYLKQLMAKFPAVNNREFVNADQGIDSGYQGRPLPAFLGRRKIRPGASCRTSPTRPRSGGTLPARAHGRAARWHDEDIVLAPEEAC